MENISDKIKEYINTHNLVPEYHKIVENLVNDPEIANFLTQNKINQQSEIFKKGISKIFEFYQASRDPQADYLARLKLENDSIEVEYYPSKRLLQKRRLEKQSQLFRLLYSPATIKRACFEDFEQNDRQDAYFKAIQFSNQLISSPTQFIKGPYFYGKFGVGKTFLLGAVANELAKKDLETLFVHIPTLVVELKNSITNHSLADLINQIRKAPVLILDDIGAENLSAWVRDDIFNPILQYRMEAKLPTLFSSNYNLAELEKHFTEVRDDYDQVKARRIIERIRFLSQEIEISGKNWRE
ncbi:primosomal protein DnaI [Xylocopilactobacillus apicola]|uniref:Primosomal protein DnaI n=1 Tax=Xylocopilactobacillus apicola TaxID=2932184 RepID=A0AAU9D1D2_9LACO|nr:primosomal protein DnaI [Xylocopilactobacillus apicola]BDR58521.1 primosomal protein DnaI [Xylocopilactobacillus apicola]